MDEVIRFLKSHKYQIKKYAKKAFTWYKKHQKEQEQQQQQGGAGGYAGAAAAGGGGGYNANYGQAAAGAPTAYQPPPPQGQYGHPQVSQSHSGQSPLKPHHPNYNDNAVNSKNKHYMELRAQARREGDLMASCFDRSHNAYSAGNGAEAKTLSNEGHAHKNRMEALNKEGADWIFAANNEDSGPDEVDLHGLYTAEAIARTEAEVAQRQARGEGSVRIIVGKGIHSKDHVAHIKPAIEQLMQKYNLQAHLDEHNSGVLVVDLTGQGGGSFGRDVGGFTRGLAKQASGQEEQCTIM